MWLLRSSPLDPRAMLWSKYWMGTVPLLVLALMITVLTNWLLQVSPFMMAVSRRQPSCSTPWRPARWR